MYREAGVKLVAGAITEENGRILLNVLVDVGGDILLAIGQLDITYELEDLGSR